MRCRRKFSVSQRLVENIVRERMRRLLYQRDNAVQARNPEYRAKKSRLSIAWAKAHPERRKKIVARSHARPAVAAKIKARMQHYYRTHRGLYKLRKRDWERQHKAEVCASSCRRLKRQRQELRRAYLVKMLKCAGRPVTEVNIQLKKQELQLWRTKRQFKLLQGGAALSQALRVSSSR